MEKSFNISSISSLDIDFKIVGKEDLYFNNASSIYDGNENSIVWIKSSLNDYQALLEKSKAPYIICDKEVKIISKLKESKCFIVCEDPKLTFLTIVQKYFIVNEIMPGIHPSAIVNSKAKIHPSVSIEANCIIGNCIIGKNSVIKANSIINDRSHLGNNVIIHSHVVIGSDGFGFVRDNGGHLNKFPHIGNVIIEDDVEIYPFSNVDLGSLGSTIIGKGSKIDHYCHIGHNSTIGTETLITAGTVLCGGSKVGDRCWIGVNSVIKEKIIVGDDVLIGLASVVSKNVPPKSTWVGAPAEPVSEFKRKRQAINKLLTD